MEAGPAAAASLVEVEARPVQDVLEVGVVVVVVVGEVGARGRWVPWKGRRAGLEGDGRGPRERRGSVDCCVSGSAAPARGGERDAAGGAGGEEGDGAHVGGPAGDEAWKESASCLCASAAPRSRS
jgi:hypothetical protein